MAKAIKLPASKSSKAVAASVEQPPVGNLSDVGQRCLDKWQKAKRQHPDHLIAFRAGDFAEFYFEDAKAVADALRIVLTTRGGAPLSFVPAPYLKRRAIDPLKELGHRVKVVGPKRKFSGDARPLTPAESRRFMASPAGAEMLRQIERKERIVRLARELGNWWDAHNGADSISVDRNSTKAQRASADKVIDDALRRIKIVEKAMVECAPHDARDAMALVALLLDRLAAVAFCCDRDDETELLHNEATTIALSLIRFLAAEAHTTPAAIGMRVYERHIFERQSPDRVDPPTLPHA